MSPRPMRSSAPGASRIVRESIWEAIANAMRLGKLALIRPVTTLTEGRWVARTMRILDVLAFAHHQVGQLVDDDHDVRHPVIRVDPCLVERPDVAGGRAGQPAV